MIFILVLYKCDLERSLSYLTITRALACANEQGTLFVFDNSEDRHAELNLDSQIWVRVEYIHCPENKGLSFAYNQGAMYAKEHGIAWMILLDQDTSFSEDYICELNEAKKLYPNINLFAPIIRLKNQKSFSPTRYKNKRGYSVALSPGVYSLFRYSPVNSGMVVKTDLFWEAGGYNPLIRLDFADFQFIERFRCIDASFVMFDSIAIQDFSNDEKDVKKLLARFKIYCECAKQCERKNFVDSLGYFYSVFRHTLGLTGRTKNISFLRIFITNYLLNK